MGLFDKLAKEGLNAVKEKLNDANLNNVKEKLENAIEDVTGIDLDKEKANTQKFCSSCGAPLEAGAKFCVKCGAKTVSSIASTQTATSTSGVSSRPASSSGAAFEYASYSQADGAVTAKFENILRTHFAGYMLKMWQSASALGFKESTPSREYDFVLYNGLKPVAVILLTPKGRDRNKVYINTKAAAEAAGVKVINFFTNFPNEEGYVVERIKKFL